LPIWFKSSATIFALAFPTTNFSLSGTHNSLLTIDSNALCGVWPQAKWDHYEPIRKCDVLLPIPVFRLSPSHSVAAKQRAFGLFFPLQAS
jgi:hypothetical protein